MLIFVFINDSIYYSSIKTLSSKGLPVFNVVKLVNIYIPQSSLISQNNKDATTVTF